jgi:hypothetical protein
MRTRHTDQRVLELPDADAHAPSGAGGVFATHIALPLELSLAAQFGDEPPSNFLLL